MKDCSVLIKISYLRITVSSNMPISWPFWRPMQPEIAVGSRSCRRSIGGLSLSPMSMSLTGPPSAPVQHNNGKSGGGIFSSWRRSYRMRSKSTAASSAHNNARKKDAKSMENLLSDDRPVPR